MVPLQTNAIVATLLIATLASVTAFISPSNGQLTQITSSSALEAKSEPVPNSYDPTRRAFLATASSSVAFFGSLPSFADEDESSVPSVSFKDIAARAAKVSQEVDDAEKIQKAKEEEDEERRRELAQKLKDDKRTIYDFTLPVGGVQKNVADLVGQTFEPATEGGEVGSKVKAILVVNIKQDDPIARKNIPELIALATKNDRFGKNGEFAVIVSPTDQGYYEPDTSALIRLKMQAEYGYGSSPATILTDKVNLLGSGALPFWRWIEGSCRTPAGLGKIQANFEKFLVDGRTGKPVRRYPRKYQPYDIADDIAALVQGRPLPPAGANYKEEWRNAAKEAENDTYRFQKGLNYFDQ
ncbi:hypothetical protein ACHAXS_014235 [Conticribra weissflogii]